MINGVHALIFSEDADGVRAFFRDVLGFASVDGGHGWPVCALPPAELGVHPADGDVRHELYLMCDDLDATIDRLEEKGVEFSRPISEENWGRVTWFRIPGGGELALYEPTHRTAPR